MIRPIHLLPALAIGATLFLSSPAAAQARSLDLGLRGIVVAADGEPANDIPGFGVFARYHFAERWALGVSLDAFEFDFERPYELLGLAGTTELDASVESYLLGVWIERVYRRPAGRLEWYWAAGLAGARLDADEVSGDLTDGGTFFIETDAGNELIVSAGAGVRWRLGTRVLLEGGVRAEQHLADWEVADRISGATTSIDDYTALGGHLAILVRLPFPQAWAHTGP